MVFPACAVERRWTFTTRIVGAGRHDGADDRRKVRVFLTAKGKRLRNELLTVARGITAEAERGITARELTTFRRVITLMTANLDRVER
jgi:DNA-binding MarR family transcriptional regulator